MWTALIALWVLSVPAPAYVAQIPFARTDVGDLSTAELKHAELLRITRDWGKPEFEIALDGWTHRDASRGIADIRVWWAKTTRSDQRSPIGKQYARHFNLKHRAMAPNHWAVDLRGGNKLFHFDVKVDDNGRPRAYGTVDKKDGTRLHECRVRRARLEARRFLGIPVGLRRLGVTCVDGSGRIHHGVLAHGKARRR